MISGNSPLILVADDEPSMLTLVAQHLRTTGYRVLEASDGEQAWTLVREHMPELVVLDVMMPGMSGWEVCRKIREDVTLAPTAVVMLTGIGENLNEMTSPLYGADEYIDKPFEFSELDSKVRSAIEAGMRRNDHPGLARTEPLTSQPPPTGAIDDAWQGPGPRRSSRPPPPELSPPPTGTRNERPKAAAKGARKSPAKVAKAKSAAKPKVKAKPKTKAKAKPTAATKAKPKTKAKAKPKAATKAKAKPKTKAKATPKAATKAKKSAPKKGGGGKAAKRGKKTRKR